MWPHKKDKEDFSKEEIKEPKEIKEQPAPDKNTVIELDGGQVEISFNSNKVIIKGKENNLMDFSNLLTEACLHQKSTSPDSKLEIELQ